MNSLSKTVFDAFIADGAKPTYTSIEHAEDLGSGRQLGITVRASKYDPSAESLITVDLEQSADGKNFMSKYLTYFDDGTPPTVAPLIFDSFYLHTDPPFRPLITVFNAAEPSPAKPNLRYSRLKITIIDGLTMASKYAHLKINVAIRGSSDLAEEAPAASRPKAPAAPGSLARHQEVISEITSIAAQSKGLPAMQRAAHLLRNVSPATKAHFQAVDKRFQALPQETRRKMMEATGTMMRHALTAAGPRPRAAAAPQEGSCCEELTKQKPCGDCGGK